MAEYAIVKWVIAHWRALALGVFLLSLTGWHFQDKISDAWDEWRIDRKQEKIEWLLAELSAKSEELGREKVNVKVVTKYVDRVQVVQGRTRTIIKEVPVYVPTGTADLPAGYRVLHDAAAQGVIPDPARIADASPVPAQDAAETVVENYGTCHETAEQVIALQDWIRAQQAVH